ncbi:hypothetical protein K461DRAFT_295872 [Myriangium duriaei CBS 260.36]|uniref:SWR1-complex protein 4 n=1 Tax=Myriangium duriaei CBS 260.36 TaxID=1168546 RepID=A0A9P4IZN5_9PEZI|nr:hypothetical protein K461DRAFT_295872 [Myriangium duriaei CBS 260.36]
MASAQDMRDVLGLPGDVPRPAKKRKVVEKRPLEKGMAREVSALMGERAPPVSMIQIQPKYKQRPRRLLKVAPWEWTPFINEARTDDLKLSHWQRKKPLKAEPGTEGSAEQSASEQQSDKATDKPYQFSKYNVQVDAPIYSDEVYQATLQDEDWTKEETDYLVDLVKDYGQKWAVVWDRYEFKPTKLEDQDSPAEPKTRTLEDLKKRYYMVRAKMLAHDTPIASMNGQQYSLYQMLTHFDVKQESCRKKMTEAHLYRTEIEVQEETALLAELQRIMVNQTSLEAARREIRDRLDHPSSSSASTQYTTSQALAQLFQQLVAADRTKKDRRLKDLPSAAQATPSGHRDSIAGVPSSATTKRPRDSLASVASGAAETPETRSRALSPHSKDRFFVTTHDRLSAGVTFASDKLTKPRIAKSTVQTERIGAVLQTLKIPDLIPLPTQRVVEDFDKLMSKVHTLLDMRKLAEKEEGEIKVRLAEKKIKEGGTGVADGGGGEGRGQKRSASVLSEASQGREKRRK